MWVEIYFTMILKPQILTHPNIPKPLHGVNPRTIMGNRWWNKTREVVYASTDYHCIACGIPKALSKGPKWLEAHEFWHIDNRTGICTIESIEPLCHYCHQFIHSGRLSMECDKSIPGWKVDAILEHGFEILSKNGLKCFYGTLKLAEDRLANTFGVTAYEHEVNPDIKWGDWKLVWNGLEYHSKFADAVEHLNHYA